MSWLLLPLEGANIINFQYYICGFNVEPDTCGSWLWIYIILRGMNDFLYHHHQAKITVPPGFKMSTFCLKSVCKLDERDWWTVHLRWNEISLWYSLGTATTSKARVKWQTKTAEGIQATFWHLDCKTIISKWRSLLPPVWAQLSLSVLYSDHLQMCLSDLITFWMQYILCAFTLYLNLGFSRCLSS